MSYVLIIAPPAGARIETSISFYLVSMILIAPPAGARIETGFASRSGEICAIAPPAGARIETVVFTSCPNASPNRTPRGCAD